MDNGIEGLHSKYQSLIESLERIGSPLAKEQAAELQRMAKTMRDSLTQGLTRLALSDSVIKSELTRLGCRITSNMVLLLQDVRHLGKRLIRDQQSRQLYWLTQERQQLILTKLSRDENPVFTDMVDFVFDKS
ncbi:hypothetical protein ACYPKM_00645 [Pseudomonas aeruginosa]